MKRKLCLILLAALIAVFAAFGLSACGSSDSDVALEMNKKYYYADYLGLDGRQRYIVFYSDGTGEYRDYYFFEANSTLNDDYTIKFKYSYADVDKSAVACFYDSVTYGSKNGGDTIDTNWYKLVNVSKNFLVVTGYSGYYLYINEDYLEDELTNFGVSK